MLTQRARPQLFSNALTPTVACSALAAVHYVEAHPERVTKLHENTKHFRAALLDAGLKPLEGETPIVPIIIGETADAIRMSEMLLDEGIFITGFGFPVVPQGTARLRCQVSAAHSFADLDFAVSSIRKIALKVGILE
jgi:glycine C-acetyltransferase